MTQTLAYRHWENSVVHLYSDCREGKLIGIARREAVHDVAAMEGLKCAGGARKRAGVTKRPKDAWSVN